MKKTVVVINGRCGVGKDTLCAFAAERYSVQNSSAITPIKEMAEIIGWRGEKDNRARALLAGLKQLAIAYNDYPNVYLRQEYQRCQESDCQVLFVHIREKEQIAHFIATVGCPVVTLLVRRQGGQTVYGNPSDDGVEDFSYDYIYHNDKPLEEARADFLDFFARILEEAP